MLRLQLQKFDFEKDERGYVTERNKCDVLNFVADPLDGTDWQKSLLEMLRVAIGAEKEKT